MATLSMRLRRSTRRPGPSEIQDNRPRPKSTNTTFRTSRIDHGVNTVSTVKQRTSRAGGSVLGTRSATIREYGSTTHPSRTRPARQTAPRLRRRWSNTREAVGLRTTKNRPVMRTALSQSQCWLCRRVNTRVFGRIKSTTKAPQRRGFSTRLSKIWIPSACATRRSS